MRKLLALLLFFAALPALADTWAVDTNVPQQPGDSTIAMAVGGAYIWTYTAGDTVGDKTAIQTSRCDRLAFTSEFTSGTAEMYGVPTASTATASGTVLYAPGASARETTNKDVGSAYLRPKVASTGSGSIRVRCYGFAPQLASRGTSVSTGLAERFQACREGAAGGDYDATTGLYGWTCGNYNFHTLLDPTMAGSFYKIVCSGDGTANGYTGPGAGSCFRSGETRWVGVLHALGTAVDRTKTGGKVYLPVGVYVDTGCGTLSNGSTRASCPDMYQAERRARSDWSTTGPTSMRQILGVERGIEVVGEATPTYETTDVGDSSVTRNRPKLGGVWILNDRGNSGAASAYGTLPACTSNDCRTPDGPNQDLQQIDYPFAMGGYDNSGAGGGYVNYCETTSNTDPRCKLTSTLVEFRATSAASEFGVVGNFDGTQTESLNELCIGNAVTGSSQANATGVCSGNKKIRCWAGGASSARSGGGCDFGAGGNFGSCLGFVDALYEETLAGRTMGLDMQVTNCGDNPTAANQCEAGMGQTGFFAEIRGTASVGACGSAGKYVSTGSYNAENHNRGWPFPWGNLIPGGSGFVGNITAVNSKLFTAGAKISHVGFMPANWVGRDSATASADCLSAGDVDNADDEKACDTQTLLGTAHVANVVYEDLAFANASMAPGVAASNVDFRPYGLRREVKFSRFFDLRRGAYLDICSANLHDNQFYGNASYESTATGAALVAIYCGDTKVDNNDFHGGTRFADHIQMLFPARYVKMRGNKWLDASGFRAIYITGGFNIEVSDNQIDGFHGDDASPIEVRVGVPQTPGADVLRGLKIFNNQLSGRFASPAGTNYPTAGILIEAEGGLTNRPEAIDGAQIFGNIFVSPEVDLCGVWLEDDCSASGTGSCTANDTSALITESRPKFSIYDNTVLSAGSPRAVCIGAYRAAGGHLDATDSRNVLLETYQPDTANNTVNGALELSTRFIEDWPFTVKAPSANDDFLIGKLLRTMSPVQLACVAQAGSGLTTIDYSIQECDGNGAGCAAIGATQTMTVIDTQPTADTSFTDSSLAAGAWLKAVAGTVTWTSAGFVTCDLRMTR